MRQLFPLTALAVAACIPPMPAWWPGEDPLTIDADSDATAEIMLAGCDLWRVVGLTCELAEGGRLEARREELDGIGPGVRGHFETQPDGVGSRYWRIQLDPVTYDLADPSKAATPDDADWRMGRAAAIAGHEIGHALGACLDGSHLPDATGALMTADVIADHVTPADVRALPWAQELGP